MKRYILTILFAALLASVAAADNQTNATITNIERYAPFNEFLQCQSNASHYNVTGLINITQYNVSTNITIGNQTYQVILANVSPQIGLQYDVEFASSIAPNGTQVNVLFIHNFDGQTVQQRDWSFKPGETQSVNFKLPFTCPADLTPQINFQTCSAFFDSYISKDEPLLFTLATGTRQCQEELANRTAQYTSCQNEARLLDNDRTTLRAEVTQKEEANKACLNDLNQPYGSCYLRILDERNNTSGCLKQKSELVPAYWQWLAMLFIILTGIIFLKQFVW